MAMKVYINGDVVELDKSGDPLLNIPRNKAIYRIENNDITIFNNDDRTIFRTDTITNIQNQAGASIGNLQDVVKYLNKSVVVRGTSITTPTTTGGGGSGEVNTASNIGAGDGVFAQKTGVDLEFKSLVAGSNITLTAGSNDITIDASGGGGGGISLTDLSVTAEGAAAGDGDLAYNNTNGEFTYSPPLLNGLSATGTTDFGANKIQYANNYATLGDLPSASTYHGMFAHVHAEGAAYYSHAGNWVKLADAGGVGGKEGFIVPTKLWSFEMHGDGGIAQPHAHGISLASIDTCPMCFNQDVNLQEVSADIIAPGGSTNFTGYVGVYELIAKTSASGVTYYQYDKLFQVTPTFNWIAGGSHGLQTLTISPNYTFIAGKVYIVICISDYTNQVYGSAVSGVYRFGDNKLLDANISFYSGAKSIRASNTFPSPYTLSFTPPTLPSTIYFTPKTSINDAKNSIQITLQNA